MTQDYVDTSHLSVDLRAVVQRQGLSVAWGGSRVRGRGDQPKVKSPGPSSLT